MGWYLDDRGETNFSISKLHFKKSTQLAWWSVQLICCEQAVYSPKGIGWFSLFSLTVPAKSIFQHSSYLMFYCFGSFIVFMRHLVLANVFFYCWLCGTNIPQLKAAFSHIDVESSYINIYQLNKYRQMWEGGSKQAAITVVLWHNTKWLKSWNVIIKYFKTVFMFCSSGKASVWLKTKCDKVQWTFCKFLMI